MAIGLVDTSVTTAANNQYSFAKVMTRIMPNGDAPMFLLSSTRPKKEAAQPTHNFFTFTPIFQSFTTHGSTILAATTALTASATVSNIVEGQIYAVGTPVGERVLVSSVSGATVNVVRAFGTVAAADIPAGTLLFLVGTAHEEGSNRPVAVRVNEVEVSNYTQIFRNAWSVTGTAAAVRKYVGVDTATGDKVECSKMHARDIELATLFGQARVTTKNSKPIRAMNGIVEIARAAGRHTAAGSTTTYAQLETALDPVFDFNTDPALGNMRKLLVGPTAFKVINNIGRLYGNYDLVKGQTEFGQRFLEFWIARGKFEMIQHPLLATNTALSKTAIVFDMGSTDYAYLAGRDTVAEEYTYSNGSLSIADSGQDAVGGSLLTELTLETRNAFACAVITNLTAAA